MHVFALVYGRRAHVEIVRHWVEISCHRALLDISFFAMLDINDAFPQDIVDNATISGVQSGPAPLVRESKVNQEMLFERQSSHVELLMDLTWNGCDIAIMQCA